MTVDNANIAKRQGNRLHDLRAGSMTYRARAATERGHRCPHSCRSLWAGFPGRICPLLMAT
jgi:hypothetical protein